jgi:hypothetical protein
VPDELNAYTVLRPVEIPWQGQAEIMTYGACEACKSDQFPFPDRNCAVCHGIPLGDAGQPLGLRPHGHPPHSYLPGQTVHLSDDVAREFLESGVLAPPGSEVVVEFRVAEAG